VANFESLPERATLKIEELKAIIDETDHIIEVNQAEYEKKLPLVESQTAPLAAQKKKVEEEISEHKPEEDRVSQEVSQWSAVPATSFSIMMLCF